MPITVFSRLGKGKGKSIRIKGIERTHKCSWCEAEGVKTHFHHRSDKPDDVVEVCEDCHKIRHGLPKFARQAIRELLR